MTTESLYQLPHSPVHLGTAENRLAKVALLLIVFMATCTWAPGQALSYASFENAHILTRASETQHDADPVYVANRAMRIRKVDLTVPSVGFPFSFVRTYNSLTLYDGPLGYGWDFNYNMRLNKDANNDITSYDGSNRLDVYPRNATDTAWLTPAGSYDTIQTGTGSTLERITSHGFTYVYEPCSDDTNWYRLKTMQDRNGNTMSFTYDATTKYGKLTTITDTNSRDYTISYNAAGRITEVKDFGTIQRKIGYAYTGTSSNDLEAVTDLSGESSLTRKTSYTYDSHRVVTITDPKENEESSPTPFLRNYYDGSSGRIIAQEYGPDASSPDTPAPTSNAFLFTYSTVGGVTKTVLTDRGGARTDYYFDTNGLITKTVHNAAVAGAPDTEYTYDSNFNILTVLRDDGTKIISAYDSNGNRTSVKTTDASSGNALEWEYDYDTTNYNQLTKVTDPGGMITNYAYDATGNLTQTQVDPSGANLITTFHYDNANHYLMDWMQDPEGAKTSFQYDSDHNLKKIIGDSGAGGLSITLAEHSFNEFGNVVWSKDGRGNQTTYTVNRLNQVTKVTAPSPLGYETEFFYDASDNLTKTEVENGTGQGSGDFVTTMEYDILDNLCKVTENIDGSTDRVTEYFYDIDDRLTRIEDPLDNEILYEYDGFGLNTKITLGYGATEAAAYTYEYDDNFRLTEIQEPNGASYATTFAYDHHDRLTKTTNALGHYTLSVFTDHLLTSTLAVKSGGSTSTPEAKTEYQYDTANRLTKSRVMMKESPTGSAIGDGWMDTEYVYDDNGNLTEVEDDGGNVTEFFFDALNRNTKVEDPIGNYITKTYDAAHNVTTLAENEKENGGATFDTYTTTFAYDNLNRLTQTTDPASKLWKYTYDARGNVVTTEDPNGSKSYSTYDELNRLIKLEQDRTSAAKITLEWEYDDSSRLVTVTDAESNDTAYAYDALNRQTSTTFADTYSVTWEYDDNGNIIERTDQNATEVTYDYDLANRLTEKTFSVTAGHIGGETTQKTFEYDALNRLTEAEDSDSLVKYVYNTGGLVESEEMRYGAAHLAAGTGKTVSWDYNAQGLATKVRYPGATATTGELRYSYDTANRLTEIERQQGGSTQDLVSWTFKGPGRIIRKDYGNDTYCEASFDSRKNVTSLEHMRTETGDDTSIVEFTYEYDSANKMTAEGIEHFENDGTLCVDKGFNYAYDDAYRLTKIYTGVPVSQLGDFPPTTYDDQMVYEFDDAGNRQTVTTTPSGGSDTEDIYTTNSTNAYSSVNFGGTTESYSYDKVGNRTSVASSVRTWHYDYQNRLVKVLEDANEYCEYDYDVLGRRIAKRFLHDGVKYQVEKRYYWAGSALIQQYDISEEEETEIEVLEFEYLWGQSTAEPVQIRKHDIVAEEFTEAAYYHQNLYASVYALTHYTSANITENYRYQVYGGATINSGDGTTPGTPFGNFFLWHGHYYDIEVTEIASGLAIYGDRPRGYDPELGAFISRASSAAGAGNAGSTSPSDRSASGLEGGAGSGMGAAMPILMRPGGLPEQLRQGEPGEGKGKGKGPEWQRDNSPGKGIPNPPRGKPIVGVPGGALGSWGGTTLNGGGDWGNDGGGPSIMIYPVGAPSAGCCGFWSLSELPSSLGQLPNALPPEFRVASVRALCGWWDYYALPGIQGLVRRFRLDDSFSRTPVEDVVNPAVNTLFLYDEVKDRYGRFTETRHHWHSIILVVIGRHWEWPRTRVALKWCARAGMVYLACSAIRLLLGTGGGAPSPTDGPDITDRQAGELLGDAMEKLQELDSEANALMEEISGLQDWGLKEAKWERVLEITREAEKLENAASVLRKLLGG